MFHELLGVVLLVSEAVGEQIIGALELVTGEDPVGERLAAIEMDSAWLTTGSPADPP
ncbi:hypothetical protein [Brachybacterium sp. UMB0905]|uniref:hypothetical protein n=1 Tax=Brachybacterium sp. UMB0905 TaxID=2069310 RepID=UPI0013047461|nr:hypothetical protein [Brachybacterium sp. UMB0905]